MPAHKDLPDLLSRSQQIQLTVTGRKSGRTISNPVWFVANEGKLLLLPVKGSETQWYKNVLENPTFRVEVNRAEAELKAVPVTEAAKVHDVIDRFREKYGASDVKKYYSKFDVAVSADLP